MADLDRAIELNPGEARAYNDKGICLAKRGDVEGALSEVERAIEASPTEPGFHRNRAVLLDRLERPDEAAGARRRAEELQAGAEPASAAPDPG